MEDKTRLVRRNLLGFAFLTTGFVVYASLVPLRYTELPWEEAVARWEQIPWLNLTIENRADWVANGLIMLPPGFFAAGAIGFRRKSSIWLWIAAPFIVAALSAIVVGIELVQVYFPPRVVSQNDVFAGLIGSVGGVALWLLLGNWLAKKLEHFFEHAPGLERWFWLAQSSLVALGLYSLLPLDVIFNWSEIQAKWQNGRFSFVPFQDFPSELKPQLKWLASLVVPGLRIVPFALVATTCRSPGYALRYGILAAFVIEALKLPIFSREFSSTDIIMSILGVIVATRVAPLAPRCLVLDRSAMWLIGTVAWCGVMTVAFLSRFDHVVTDPVVLQERVRDIFTIPFARAHRSSEFNAGVNILLKWIAFGTLAFLVCGWRSRRNPSSETQTLKNAPWVVLIFSGASMGIGIELAQIFLIPLVPDATDWITYSLGMLIGIIAFRLLVPSQAVLKDQLESFFRPSQSSFAQKSESSESAT